MRTYRGVVVFRYYQEIEVKADDADQAQALMYEIFNLGKADSGSEILDFEELK